MEPGWSIDMYGNHMHTIIEHTARETLAILRTAKKDCLEFGCDLKEMWGSKYTETILARQSEKVRA
jgi:hypothetical protein